MRFLALYLLAPAVILSALALAQRTSGWPHPPEPAEKPVFRAGVSEATVRFKADPVQLQRDARELLELSQSIQPDIDFVNHGLLPKDTIEKLKRIEKLSKRLRSELGP